MADGTEYHLENLPVEIQAVRYSTLSALTAEVGETNYFVSTFVNVHREMFILYRRGSPTVGPLFLTGDELDWVPHRVKPELDGAPVFYEYKPDGFIFSPAEALWFKACTVVLAEQS